MILKTSSELLDIADEVSLLDHALSYRLRQAAESVSAMEDMIEGVAEAHRQEKRAQLRTHSLQESGKVLMLGDTRFRLLVRERNPIHEGA